MAITVLPGSPVLGEADIRIWRNSNRPRPIWRFAMDLAGSEMRLRVRWRGGGFDVSSAAAGLYGQLLLLTERDIDRSADPPPRPTYRDVVCWAFTPLAAAEIPLGRIAQYQLDRHAVFRADGEQRAYREGYFLGMGLS